MCKTFFKYIWDKGKKMNYQIGQFSRITQLTVKTLRYYQDAGLLEPAFTDASTGYRFYNESSLERVRIIKELKKIDFSISQIRDILENCGDDSDILPMIKKKALEIDEKIKKYRDVQKKIESIIKAESKMKEKNIERDIIVKEIKDKIVAGIRFKGKYEEVGNCFGRLFKNLGRFYGGETFSLHYDGDYKENDADIEACISLKKDVNKKGTTTKVLNGGKAVTIIHKGPYETLGNSYKKIYEFISMGELKIHLPTREIYLKGPGTIFRGNPKKYITEIQMFIV